MQEKDMEIMKNLIAAKKNRPSTPYQANLAPGKTYTPELKARKAYRNRKSGGVFDK